MVKLQKISDDDYEIIDRGEENFHHIRIKAATYKDVVYQYGAVRLFEENDSLRISFDYEVFANPNNLYIDGGAFKEYIGHILVNNLEEILMYNKYQKGNNGV
jgi:hypothetical protein